VLEHRASLHHDHSETARCRAQHSDAEQEVSSLAVGRAEWLAEWFESCTADAGSSAVEHIENFAPASHRYQESERIMIPSKHRTKRVAQVTAGLVVSSCLAAAAYAQSSDKVGAVIGEQVKAEEAAQASQRRVAALDDEATKMLSEYRMAIAEAQSLTGYNDQLAAQVKSQNDEVEAMTKQLSEIETTSKEVLPMMQKMVSTLEQFVKLDMPFLPDERANRVSQLKDLMTRADVSVSEKYRRIVEAYQIEIEYGRTLEAYQGKIDEKTVDFLRAGRISLMYQTLDGKETGYWDRDKQKWVVDNSYGSVINAGLKVAKKQAAPDFITVAVPAPKEIS
jgi:hypothetical protein